MTAYFLIGKSVAKRKKGTNFKACKQHIGTNKLN